MNLLLWIAVLIVSLYCLVKSCNVFISASEKIGNYIGIPAFITGIIFVGIGTSLPELVSSIIAITKNSPEIVIGNVLGSNVLNILLLVAIASFVNKGVEFNDNLNRIDLPYLIGSAFLVALMMIDGKFSRGEAIISLVCLGSYIFGCFRNCKNFSTEKQNIKLKDIILFFICPLFIFLGGKYAVDSVIQISQRVTISMEAIAFSVVAFGTSLPEIIVTIVASRKGKFSLVIGNIIGGTIFKTFAVMGIPSLINTLTISKSIIMFCLPVSVAATVLFTYVVADKRINRCEGAFLLMFYIFFILKLYNVV